MHGNFVRYYNEQAGLNNSRDRACLPRYLIDVLFHACMLFSSISYAVLTCILTNVHINKGAYRQLLFLE